MNTTHDQLRQKGKRRGFTLIEMLVSISLLALAAGVVLPTSIFLIKSNVALGNSTFMTTKGRQLVDQFGADIRSTVDITKVADRTLEITVEDPDKTQTTILYHYDPQTDSLSRKVGKNRARVIIDDIVSLKFVYYDAKNEVTTKLIDTKKVEVQMTLKMSVMGKSQSFEQKSTRFVMRNRVTPTSV